MSAAAPRIRTARVEDAGDLFRLAEKAGSGLTNLPAELSALEERLSQSVEAMTGAEPPSRPLMLVIEVGGHVQGTAMVLPRVGAEWPFYSYKISRLSQTSRAHRKSISCRMLNLVNDFDGYAEVGGLLVDPALRGTGGGRMIARSRYMFIAEHRGWFGECVVSELRGVQDDQGRSPFWDAVGRRFYDMDFEAADRLNGLEGNQFIADLGPKFPIYINLLPDEAQAVIGELHKDSRRAYELLVEEGFRDEDYVDIFDAGPTIYASINELKAVRENRTSTIAGIGEPGPAAVDSLASLGHGLDFRAARGRIAAGEDGAVIEPALAEALGVKTGDQVRHVRF